MQVTRYARRALAALGLLLGASACEKDLLDVNQHPTSPTSTDIMFVLPAGQAQVSFIVGGQYNVLGSILAQHLASPFLNGQYISYDRYNLNSSTLDFRQFQNLYAGALTDFEYVIKEGSKTNEFRLVGIAKVLKAHTYQLLTDLYGDLPYSEALQPELTKTPKYDRQQAIYTGLQTLLDEAIADIGRNQGRLPGNNDLNYRVGVDADMDKWIRLARTLKLRLYLRLSQVDPAAAQAGIEALYQAGSNPDVLFMRSGEDFQFLHARDGAADNPFYQVNTRLPNNLAISSTLGKMMLATSDPRRSIYCLDADLSTATMDYGFVDPGQAAPARFCHPGLPFIGSNFTQGTLQGASSVAYTQFDAFARSRPTLLLTYEESLFLRAEAAVRNWAPAPENAQTLYENGVRASIARSLSAYTNGPAISLGLANTYLAQAAVSFAAPANATPTARRQLISTQKWLSYFGTNGVEAWTEARRTNTPALVAPANNALGAGRFVLRLPYPSSELQRNPHVAATGLAPGDVTTPVWWDVN